MSELSRACRPVAGASGQCQRLAVRLLAAASPPMPEPYPSRSGLVLDGGDLPELIPELIPERGLGEPVWWGLGGPGRGASRAARGGAFAAYIRRAHRAKGRADVAAGVAATVGCRRLTGGGGGHGRGPNGREGGLGGAARVFLPDEGHVVYCCEGDDVDDDDDDDDDDDVDDVDDDAMLRMMMATG